eukprot:scaffold1334_cov344-Prasinococcus_capsulatus_cf.AAC.6
MTLTDAIAAIGRADDLQKKQLEEEAEETAATATTATTSMENVQSPTTDAASDAGSLPTSGAPPLRLVGSSIGALAAAFYAEQNRGAVDRLFLMSPVFGTQHATAAAPQREPTAAVTCSIFTPKSCATTPLSNAVLRLHHSCYCARA